MKKYVTHTFYYVLCRYSENGELEWHVVSDISTIYDTAKAKYDSLVTEGRFPCKLKSKTITYEELEDYEPN